MKKYSYFLFVLLIGLSISFSSCEKSGCTDTSACNYDSEAKKDDGSCRYNRNVQTFQQSVFLHEYATFNNFAKLTFDQYRFESCYADDTYGVVLFVENVTDDTISIACEIVMQTDTWTQHWSYDLSVDHLPPGMVDSIGVISSNPISIEGKEFDFPGIYTTTTH